MYLRFVLVCLAFLLPTTSLAGSCADIKSWQLLQEEDIGFSGIPYYSVRGDYLAIRGTTAVRIYRTDSFSLIAELPPSNHLAWSWSDNLLA